MFCAAIPMSAALGAAATAKHAERRKQALSKGEVFVNPLPVGKMSVVVMGGLIVGSAVYHLVIMLRTGMIM